MFRIKTQIRVIYADTDAMGIVYHTNYIKWFEVGRNEYLRELGYPYFVKPANCGSSVGVHKVKHRGEALACLQDAFRYDTKVLLEQACLGQEVECAVLGNESPEASVVGEIRPTHEFYDYAAKYVDENGAELIIPARLSAKTSACVRRLAVAAFQALECEGMARVDFFVTHDDPEGVFLNEINTIPGFTPISMYPRLWEASGRAMPSCSHGSSTWR